MRIPMISADEIDAIEHQNVVNWKAGERRRIKRGYRLRQRRIARLAIRSEEM